MAIPGRSEIERVLARDYRDHNARLGRVIRGNPGPQYAVSKEGRFLLNATVERNASTVIRMILNWSPQNDTR